MKKILIVGGGIAGLTAMRFLTKLGLDTHLIEKYPGFRPEGAGIMLGINAMKLLSELDLAEEIRSQGQVLDSFSMVDRQGCLIATSDSTYMEAQTGYNTVAIHRRLLQTILSKALNKEKIRFHLTLTKLEQKELAIQVTFSNTETEMFDMVIAADGIHSSTRSLMGLPSKLRYSGYTCWRFVMECPESLLACKTGYEYWGKGRRFGVVPLAENQLYCFATVNSQENNTQHRDISSTEFKLLFSEFGGVVPEILNALSDENVLIHGDLYDQLAIHLQTGKVALIGDAAHAATPNMGQGAGMAIEDAYILGKCLASDQEIPAALKNYEARRCKRVKFIRDRSYQVGKIAQWEAPWAMATRNAILRLLPRQGLSKDQCKLLLDY